MLEKDDPHLLAYLKIMEKDRVILTEFELFEIFMQFVEALEGRHESEKDSLYYQISFSALRKFYFQLDKYRNETFSAFIIKHF